MFGLGSDGRCPRCSGSRLWRSGSGWLRYPARLLFLYPLRCDHCQARFWRFRWAPPPLAHHRRRSGSGRPRVNPAGGANTPPPVG